MEARVKIDNFPRAGYPTTNPTMITLYDLVGCCVVNVVAAGLCCWLEGCLAAPVSGQRAGCAEGAELRSTPVVRDGWSRGRATW